MTFFSVRFFCTRYCPSNIGYIKHTLLADPSHLQAIPCWFQSWAGLTVTSHTARADIWEMFIPVVRQRCEGSSSCELNGTTWGKSRFLSSSFDGDTSLKDRAGSPQPSPALQWLSSSTHPFVLPPTLCCSEQPLPPPPWQNLLLSNPPKQLLMGDHEIFAHPVLEKQKPEQRSCTLCSCQLWLKK